MKNNIFRTLIVLGVAALFLTGSGAATPIRIMLLDGESGGPYHKWQIVTAVLRKEL